MKKVIAFILAIISAASLCLPAFAKDVDYSQMDINEYMYNFRNQYLPDLESYSSKPAKTLLYYKTARLSDAEAERQARDICEKAVIEVFGKHTYYEIYVNIEYNIYLYNKKVFNKAVEKIYAKQERFFAAYGDKFDSEGEFMTKEHIAGELYTHLCLYELSYRLTFLDSFGALYKKAKIVDINPYNDEMSDSFIDAVGAVVLR